MISFDGEEVTSAPLLESLITLEKERQYIINP